jgi:competence protein ComEA
MSGIPTRRLLVYIAAGLVVLVVSTLGLISMRSGSGGPGDGVIIEASASTSGSGDGLGPPTSSSTTSTTQTPTIWVQVSGAVRRPGVYQVASDARVFQAVGQAGGFAEDADQQAIALAAKLSDGCRVYVPRFGEPLGETVRPPETQTAGAGGATTGIVSLNSGTLEQLDALPGVGPAIAQQIITYRETQGPFTSIDQLTDVPGIGPAKLEQLRPLVGL